jgi:hypothetical protein
MGQHVFVAMESDYDGAWIYGIYTTLDGAMAKLRAIFPPCAKHPTVKGRETYCSKCDRYMFVEEWPLGGGERINSYDYKPS